MLIVARWVSLVLLLMLAGLQLKLWVSGGMRDVWRIELAVRHQEAENAKQQGRNEQLAAEVSDLKEGAEAIEERARSELGMVKNDEVFYQVIEDNGPLVDDFAERLTDSDPGHLSDFAVSGGAAAEQLAQAAH
jgi:cell division protein FtsB